MIIEKYVKFSIFYINFSFKIANNSLNKAKKKYLIRHIINVLILFAFWLFPTIRYLKNFFESNRIDDESNIIDLVGNLINLFKFPLYFLYLHFFLNL